MKKKLIPVLIAIFLILIITAIAAVTFLIEKYSYSKEHADLTAYFGLQEETDVAILLNDTLMEDKGRLRDGRCYLTLDMVQTYLSDRFYWDKSEQRLLYTLPLEVVGIGLEEQTSEGYVAIFEQDDRLWIALDYAKKYADFTFTLYTGPNRVLLTTLWEQRKVVEVAKDTAIRLSDDIKSEILAEVVKGDKLILLEEMEKWDRVRTGDGYIGYIECKRLGEAAAETPEKDSGYEAPDYSGNVRDHKINLVWHQVTNDTANATLQRMMEGVAGVNVISPTWFFLYDNNGRVESIADKSYVEWAHQQGYEVWALIDDFTHRQDNGVDPQIILADGQKRRQIIELVMNEVLACGIDGINVDFEKITEAGGEDYIQFIRELSVACRKNAIVLSVDNYVPQVYNAHYHWKEQGVMADYVIVMGYDEHWSGCEEAGSVASLGYVEDGIARMVEEVPSEKVINAVPLYTRIWTTDGDGMVGSQAMGIQNAFATLQKNGVAYSWDETTSQNYAEYQTEEGLCQVWLEDEQSLAAKITVMKKYNVAGIAAWKLGFDEGRKNIWSIIAGFLLE